MSILWSASLLTDEADALKQSMDAALSRIVELCSRARAATSQIERLLNPLPRADGDAHIQMTVLEEYLATAKSWGFGAASSALGNLRSVWSSLRPVINSPTIGRSLQGQMISQLLNYLHLSCNSEVEAMVQYSGLQDKAREVSAAVKNLLAGLPPVLPAPVVRDEHNPEPDAPQRDVSPQQVVLSVRSPVAEPGGVWDVGCPRTLKPSAL